MYLCHSCERAINSASAVCPYCGAEQPDAASPSPRAAGGSGRTLKLVIAFILSVAGIWAIIWFALPLRFANPRPAAERDAVEAVRSLQHQLSTYEYGAGNFPRTLQSLGKPARQSAQLAMSGGYTIRYTPRHRGADGNAHSYTLLALPRNYGYESLYTDPSGVVHATRDNRPATAQDPVLK